MPASSDAHLPFAAVHLPPFIMSTSAATKPAAIVEVDAHDLPVHCPNPKMPLWCHHPRVFLDVTATGDATCPYCGTTYRVKAGAAIKGHH